MIGEVVWPEQAPTARVLTTLVAFWLVWLRARGRRVLGGPVPARGVCRTGLGRSRLVGVHHPARAVALHDHDARLPVAQTPGVGLRRFQPGERPGPHEADRPPRRAGPLVLRA